MIINGNAVHLPLAGNSVQCVVTSPPYWNLRDYGTARWEGGDPDCDHKAGGASRIGKTTLGGGTATTGHQQEGFGPVCRKCGARRIDAQLGLEPTPEEYVANLVAVFREVRRVLRADGVVWLNLGDSYASGKGTCYNPGGGATSLGQERKAAGAHPLDRGNKSTLAAVGLKPKDLVGIPWRVAFALQADGWWLRSDIIWAKPNPMPESVKDRCTRSHEYVFMLTKSARYYYDAQAVKEECGNNTHGGSPGNRGKRQEQLGQNAGGNLGDWDTSKGRNRRDVWTITTKPFKGAHFATMPPDLAEICIRAGTSQRGCCPKCGAPWERVTERERYKVSDSKRYSGNGDRNDSEDGRYESSHSTIGWRPTCDCDAGDPVPCVVLDPFAGAGTVGLVASRLGRRHIGVELSLEYCQMAEQRIYDDAPLLAGVAL